MDQPPLQLEIVDDKKKLTLGWSQFFQKAATKYTMPGLPVYADNVTAKAAGLKVGANYRTATGQVMVVF